MEAKRVVIVGAGLSGLTCGLKLSKAGFDVHIIEELTYPGGLLASTRIGKEYLELLPHHLRKTDRALLALAKEAGINDSIEWFDSLWSGRASRRKVGYFQGGFAGLINIMIQEITDNGGRITYSTTVSEISDRSETLEDGTVVPAFTTSCVLPNSGRIDIDSDYVIFTGSCRTFVNVSHGLPISMNMRDQLMNITYKATISLMMVLKRNFSEMYFQKIHSGSEGAVFKRIVSHSNCVGTRGYGGHIVYLVGECQISDPLWIASDEDIMKLYFQAFHKMYPVIKKTDIKSWRLTKTRYAVSERYPDQLLTNPLPGLYVCASGLTKHNTSETPENRMDRVVTLAGQISASLIESVTRASEDEDPTIITPIVSGV